MPVYIAQMSGGRESLIWPRRTYTTLNINSIKRHIPNKGLDFRGNFKLIEGFFFPRWNVAQRSMNKLGIGKKILLEISPGV